MLVKLITAKIINKRCAGLITIFIILRSNTDKMKLSIYSQKELNFVELNLTGTDKDYNKLDAESRYVDSVVFNLFTACFEKSNKLYEYYDATKYNTRYIIPLRNQLLTHLVILQKIRSLSEFQSLLDEKVFGKDFLLAVVRMDKTWMDHWTIYHEKMVNINQELLDLVDYCIDEDHNLYVIGY